MRPFWGTMSAEGKKHDLATGPRSRTGTMNMTLAANVGYSKEIFNVDCRSHYSGELRAMFTITVGESNTLVIGWRAGDAGRFVSKGEILLRTQDADMDIANIGEVEEAAQSALVSIFLQLKESGVDINRAIQRATDSVKAA